MLLSKLATFSTTLQTSGTCPKEMLAPKSYVAGICLHIYIRELALESGGS